MIFRKSLLVLLLFFGTAVPGFSQFYTDSYTITGVHVIDVMQNRVLENQTILIEDGLIVSISGQTTFSDSVIQISMNGKYVIPGLVDTHVHFGTDPTEIDNRATTEGVLKNMLMSGITSVRDMAGDTRALADLSRDALVGDIVAPNIYYSSLMAGPEFFEDPRTVSSAKGLSSGQTSFMRAVTDSTNLELAVAEAKGTGATGIKLYTMLSAELAEKITREAHKQGMEVWAHVSLGSDGADKEEVIKAGVDVVSHVGRTIDFSEIRENENWGHYLDKDDAFWDNYYEQAGFDSYLDLLEEYNTIFEPTSLVYSRRLDDLKNQQETPESSLAYPEMVLEINRRFLAEANERGIRIATGTDTDQEIFVQEEIAMLVEDAGFRPMKALKSATLVGAETIGIEDQTGSIESGKMADLVILAKNPLEDIRNIHAVDFVIKGGIIFSSGN